jgi:hypothetical protein
MSHSYITETFIDYDLPTSPELQYANDISLILFTKFYLRIQKIIFQTYKNAPAKFLGLLFLEELQIIIYLVVYILLKQYKEHIKETSRKD